jgi:hypothetical protein
MTSAVKTSGLQKVGNVGITTNYERKEKGVNG